MADSTKNSSDSKEIQRLQKENKRLLKRFDRIVDQGDRQQKQYEKLNEHLQSYINITDDHIITVTLNKERLITSVSTAFSNAFGFASDEVVGQSYEFLLHNDHIDTFNAALVDFENSTLSWHGELQHITKAETVLWTSSEITPSVDVDSGEIFEYTVVSKNITQEKELLKIKAGKQSEKEYSQSMLEFMGSRSSALLQRASKKLSRTLWLMFAAIVWFMIWASYTEIDELAQGQGKVIPSMQMQKVQSEDGGRVIKVYIKEGSIVEKGDLLFKLNAIDASSTFAQNKVRLNELRAKLARLTAEANNLRFNPGKKLLLDSPEMVEHERSLYISNFNQRNSKVNALREKMIQYQNSLREAKGKFRGLHINFNLLSEEIAIKEGLLKDKIISKVEFLQLRRQKNELLSEINSMEKEITNMESSIQEVRSNIKVTKLDFLTKAKEQLNEVSPELKRLEEAQMKLSDKVNRTAVYAPMRGTINQINITTEGEVVKAGAVLAELVPFEDRLIIEAKIKPSDIAFLRLDHDSMVKFTSYDFSVYGGLKAKIIYLSADTIVDKVDGKSYYIAHLRTEKSYLGSKEKPLYIKVGMIADVDMLLGKKSVMDYILKPILKAKQSALSER